MIYFLIAYFLLVNIAAFVAFGVDKRKATKDKRRISEATLLELIAAGGVIGGIWGMNYFRHKTIKSGFLRKFRLIIVGRIILASAFLILQ